MPLKYLRQKIRGRDETVAAAYARAHLELPDDFRADGGAIGGNEEIHALYNVQENLVLAIRDALGTPGNSTRYCGRRLGHSDKLVRLLNNILLQNAAVRDLWVAEINHLVQQLIYNHKIVPNRFLFELPQILLQHCDEVIQESEKQRGVAVSLGYGYKVHVGVLDVHVADAVGLEHGVRAGLLFVQDEARKRLHAVHGDIAPVVARDYDLALGIKDEYC